MTGRQHFESKKTKSISPMYLDTVPLALELKQCLKMRLRETMDILISTQMTEAKPAKEMHND